jgi:hypothetical protein
VSQEKGTPIITNSNQVYFARLPHYESQGLLLRGELVKSVEMPWLGTSGANGSFDPSRPEDR